MQRLPPSGCYVSNTLKFSEKMPITAIRGEYISRRCIMDVDAIASLVTAQSAAQTQSDVSTAVAKKVMDTVRSEGDLVLQMMQKAMGIGQNVNISI
jgi:hypothetical protein